MTPEQNKHIEQAAEIFYETEYNNLPGRSGNRIIGTFIAGAEYAFTNLSLGGWVRASEIKPDNENVLWRRKNSGTYLDQLFIYTLTEKGLLYSHEHILFDELEWYDETLSPSDKDKEYQAEWEFVQIMNENYQAAKRSDEYLFSGKTKKEAVLEIYEDLLEIIKGLPLKRNHKVDFSFLDDKEKDKEIERLRGIINHVHNLAADDIPDGVGPCEDAARKIIDIDAYLTEALNTKEV